MDSPEDLSPFGQMNRPMAKSLMLDRSQFDIRFQPSGMVTNGQLTTIEGHDSMDLEGHVNELNTFLHDIYLEAFPDARLCLGDLSLRVPVS
jgi:hypothetical protein